MFDRYMLATIPTTRKMNRVRIAPSIVLKVSLYL